MSKLFVRQPDAVSLQIDTEDSIHYELNDYFTFETPNAKFSPAFRARRWDGKTRLYSIKTHKLPAGLVLQLVQFCNDRDIKIKLDSSVQKPEDQNVLDYVKNLPIHAHGNPIEFRDYQLDAIQYASSSKRALIESPTSSGKSLILYGLARHQLSQKKKVLIIVPTVGLVTQLFNDFGMYSSKDSDWDTDHHTVHTIFSGMEKESKAPITISTWQSIYNMPKSFFDKFDAVYCDEVHLAEAKSIRGILNKLSNCHHRVGLTGTLKDGKVHRLVLEGLFGPVKKMTTTKKLMENKTVSELLIHCCLLKHTREEKELVMGESDYNFEIDQIISNKKRNEFILNIPKKYKGNTLILFSFVDKHGKPLYELAKKKYPKRNVYFVDGSVSKEEREDIRQRVEKEDGSIIIASYGTFSTGISIKRLHNLIFASPSKSKIRVLQSIGRQLRIADDKEKAHLFDIVDDYSLSKSKPNYAVKHFIERLKYYAKEGFDYKLYKLEIQGGTTNAPKKDSEASLILD